VGHQLGVAVDALDRVDEGLALVLSFGLRFRLELELELELVLRLVLVLALDRRIAVVN